MSFSDIHYKGLPHSVSGLLQSAGGLRHAFTTRHGGVSGGMFESLNLGVDRGDEYENVLQNYERICAALNLNKEHSVFSKQVHGDTIKTVSRKDYGYGLFRERDYEADALITDEPGAVLVTFWADCVPVILYDPVRHAAAAIHAGWRGTALDIGGKAVAALQAQYGCEPANLVAAIGPCISSCCFETDGDVPQAMRELLGAEAEAFIRPRGGKWLVDLKGINHRLLLRRGIANIDVSGDCTVCMPEKYWSHRLAGAGRGTQATLVSLTQ